VEHYVEGGARARALGVHPVLVSFRDVLLVVRLGREDGELHGCARGKDGEASCVGFELGQSNKGKKKEKGHENRRQDKDNGLCGRIFRLLGGPWLALLDDGWMHVKRFPAVAPVGRWGYPPTIGASTVPAVRLSGPPGGAESSGLGNPKAPNFCQISVVGKPRLLYSTSGRLSQLAGAIISEMPKYLPRSHNMSAHSIPQTNNGLSTGTNPRGQQTPPSDRRLCAAGPGRRGTRRAARPRARPVRGPRQRW